MRSIALCRRIVMLACGNPLINPQNRDEPRNMADEMEAPKRESLNTMPQNRDEPRNMADEMEAPQRESLNTMPQNRDEQVEAPQTESVDKMTQNREEQVEAPQRESVDKMTQNREEQVEAPRRRSVIIMRQSRVEPRYLPDYETDDSETESEASVEDTQIFSSDLTRYLICYGAPIFKEMVRHERGDMAEQMEDYGNEPYDVVIYEPGLGFGYEEGFWTRARENVEYWYQMSIIAIPQRIKALFSCSYVSFRMMVALLAIAFLVFVAGVVIAGEGKNFVKAPDMLIVVPRASSELDKGVYIINAQNSDHFIELKNCIVNFLKRTNGTVAPRNGSSN